MDFSEVEVYRYINVIDLLVNLRYFYIFINTIFVVVHFWFSTFHITVGICARKKYTR